MRLKKSVTKSNTTYCIIRDYRNINGKKSTYVYENLDNEKKLKERFGNDNTLDKVKEYITSLNEKIKNEQEEIININLNPNKQIEKDINRLFFSGHFFLRKIYYGLGIDKKIYDNEEKYNGLYGITTNLINDTQTIIKVMNGRWKIEESFRIMKDEFDAGTVHLSREDRIKGHFITCYLSLFIYR